MIILDRHAFLEFKNDKCEIGSAMDECHPENVKGNTEGSSEITTRRERRGREMKHVRQTRDERFSRRERQVSIR